MPKRPKWSKGEVEWIVNRLHVSLTDDAVRLDIARRMPRTKWTDAQIGDAMAYAVECHHKNRETYLNVMRGV